MTRDDIIRMAKEVGLPKWYQDDALVNESLVLKFANLVAAAERDRLILAAERCIVCEQRRICHETSKKNALG